MIETKEEYMSLVKRLRALRDKKKLSKFLEHKLEGLEECETLINKITPRYFCEQHPNAKTYISQTGAVCCVRCFSVVGQIHN